VIAMASIPPGDPHRDRAGRPHRNRTVPVVMFVLAAIVVVLVVLL
jgi:hypothetical protein